jgi:16S rRNA (uracil1498-N3)-methyltransferase
MHRFFLPTGSIQQDSVVFPPETAHQISRVLRLHAGQHVGVLDGSGMEYEVELIVVAQGQVSGAIVTRHPSPGEPQLSITLYLALTQREKFEWALQKCTEVGASAFVPLVTARSLEQNPVEAARKAARWGSILREAAEQSGRGRIPDLLPPVRFTDSLTNACKSDLALIAWEQEQVRTLRAELQPLRAQNGKTLAMFIGPEGGFESREVELACQAGIHPVTLGRRTLRMETAAVVACVLALAFAE